MKTYGIEAASLLSGVLLLTLLVFTSTAHAEGGRGNGDGKGSGMSAGRIISDRMADRLDLDDTQRQTIDNIVAAAKPEMDALREQRQSNREAMAALDSSDANYSIELEQAATEKGRLATEATLLHSRVRTEVTAVLTEEQRAEFEQSKERRKKRGERGKRGNGDCSRSEGEAS